MKPAALFLIFVSFLGAADFQAGLDAYNRGDFAAAMKEWQPIAEKGDAHAQYNLGLLYARGQGVGQNYQQAAEWYRKAAEQGVAAAQYNLGLMYANGQGVSRNPQEAATWFSKAAGQGVRIAETSLGRMYAEGDGSFKNPAEALKWYQKAADQGIASAAFDVGVMYDLGRGVPQSYDEAMKWYRKAADAGYGPALSNIGILYYNGQGPKRDLVQAYTWFARAQELGDPRAPELLKAASNKLRPGDMKKAQKLADEWQPPAKPAAQVADAGLFKPRPAGAATAAEAPTTVARAEAPAAGSAGAGGGAPGARPVPGGGAEAGEPSVLTGVERVIAVGDVHGDYEQFAAVLRSAGLIDNYGNWSGGKAHLVQTGDVVDRGPDSRAVMDLLRKLEKQAAAAGGGVHCLIGNHEAMDLYGDLRYVSPAEFASYRGSNSEANREAILAPATLTGGERPAEANNPPAGFAEHRAAFAPDGEYGKWIRSHDAVIKIDRTLFVHAGLGAKYAEWTIDRINNQVRQELTDFTRLHGGIATDEDGPLWYPGLAEGDEAQLAGTVDRLLKHFDVDRIVIGHTYSGGAITPRFGGKVVMIDLGLPRFYDNVGQLGCLEIDRGHVYALHRGQGLELPKDEGPDMLRYLRQAAAADPQPSPLKGRIAKLEERLSGVRR